MGGAHAVLSASGSYKWLNCPASIQLEANFEEKESVYALEGVFAHELCEFVLHKMRASVPIDWEKDTEELQRCCKKQGYNFEDMKKGAECYRDYIIEQGTPKQFFIEKRLDYSFWATDGFGTGDCVLVYDKHIHIIDYKFGKGVKVDAPNNPQLMLYGLGALMEFNLLGDINTVKFSIVQPRLDHISEWEIPANKLYEWGSDVVQPKAELALSGEGGAYAGVHCSKGFCKARGACKTYALYHLNTLSSHDRKHPSLLTNDEIASIMQVADTYKGWVDGVKAYTLEKLLQGELIKGLKVVEGKSLRKYSDENAVIEILKKQKVKKADYMEERILSVPKLEVLLGKERFNNLLGSLVVKPTGSPTIAFEDDKRPVYNSALHDFKDINI